MLRRILSYFIPVKIDSRNSLLSKKLEVTWNNGELVLDSQNTNYSYGSLQRILRKGLKKIGYQEIAQMQEILVLGVAGGSVIKTLVDEIKTNAQITGVEIDAEVISLANQYFGLDSIDQLQIVIDDAFEFVLKTKKQYDLIIVDIFQDTQMPNFLFESFFAQRLLEILSENGVILFNTMTLNEKDNLRNEEYLKMLATKSCEITLLPRVEDHNQLIIIHKKS